LEQEIREACAVLVVIGRNWVSAEDTAGHRRLDDPADYVRVEVETALRLGVPVVPLTVSRAPMPSAADLPYPLRELSTRNGLAIRPDPDFHRDMDRLISHLTGPLRVPVPPIAIRVPVDSR